MSRFSKVKELQEQEAQADAPWSYTIQGDKARIWGPDGDEVATVWDNLGLDVSAESRAKSIVEMHNAGWLLKVAGKFQPGDAEILDRLETALDQTVWKGRFAKDVACLRRLQEAAQAMEDE